MFLLQYTVKLELNRPKGSTIVKSLIKSSLRVRSLFIQRSLKVLVLRYCENDMGMYEKILRTFNNFNKIVDVIKGEVCRVA